MTDEIKALLKEWEALKAVGSRSGDHYTTTSHAVDRVDAVIDRLREEMGK